ncbi:MAG: hypothetical protein K6T78_02090 [Alicyclobacillus sp.]|nr:hypothetical protein [Alicyclobacillus sp.]
MSEDASRSSSPETTLVQTDSPDDFPYEGHVAGKVPSWVGPAVPADEPIHPAERAHGPRTNRWTARDNPNDLE